MMNRSLHQGEPLLPLIDGVGPRRAGHYRRRAGIVQMIRRLGAAAGADLRVAVRAERVVLLRLGLERFRLAPRPASHLRVLVYVALQSITRYRVSGISFSRDTLRLRLRLRNATRNAA